MTTNIGTKLMPNNISIQRARTSGNPNKRVFYYCQTSVLFFKKIIPEYKIIHLRNSNRVHQQMCLANNDQHEETRLVLFFLKPCWAEQVK